MEILTLNGTGFAVALAMGALFVFFGGNLWWFFLSGMLLFLILSAVVTGLGKDYKRKKILGQDLRGVRNVVANGLMPLVLAGMYWVFMSLGAQMLATLWLFGFVCSIAAITSDKFASEIGVLNGMPISLIGGKTVRKGVSGAVTGLGLTASAVAALIIGVVMLSLHYPLIGSGPYLALCIIVFAGFAGSFIDSLAGYYEEMGIGNKFTSNFLCSVAGAALGIALIMLL